MTKKVSPSTVAGVSVLAGVGLAIGWIVMEDNPCWIENKGTST